MPRPARLVSSWSETDVTGTSDPLETVTEEAPPADVLFLIDDVPRTLEGVDLAEPGAERVAAGELLVEETPDVEDAVELLGFAGVSLTTDVGLGTPDDALPADLPVVGGAA